MTPELPKTFALRLRVPGWARGRPVPSDLYRYERADDAFVALVVKEAQCGLNDLRHICSAQMTFTAPSIEIRLQFLPPLPVVLDLPEMLPLTAKRFRKRIGQSKRNELRQLRFVAMRQITALVPAAKSLLEIF